MWHRLLFLLVSAPFLPSVYAQEIAKVEKHKTKLESFIAQNKVVIVQGSTVMGTAKGLFGSSIVVDSKEFTNPVSGKKEYGISIKVKETSRVEQENISYVDYDEIESLLKGLDYICTIEKSATKLDNFQADYKTRSDLVLSTFNTETGYTLLAIKSGTSKVANAYFMKEDINQVRDLIVKAKAGLDSIK